MRANEYREAIAWNAHRAVAEAIEKIDAGEVPDSERCQISVVIRIQTPEWPKTAQSGRRFSSIIGDASCVYVTRDWEGGS